MWAKQKSHFLSIKNAGTFPIENMNAALGGNLSNNLLVCQERGKVNDSSSRGLNVNFYVSPPFEISSMFRPNMSV